MKLEDFLIAVSISLFVIVMFVFSILPISVLEGYTILRFFFFPLISSKLAILLACSCFSSLMILCISVVPIEISLYCFFNFIDLSPPPLFFWMSLEKRFICFIYLFKESAFSFIDLHYCLVCIYYI